MTRLGDTPYGQELLYIIVVWQNRMKKKSIAFEFIATLLKRANTARLPMHLVLAARLVRKIALHLSSLLTSCTTHPCILRNLAPSRTLENLAPSKARNLRFVARCGRRKPSRSKASQSRFSRGSGKVDATLSPWPLPTTNVEKQRPATPRLTKCRTWCSSRSSCW
jgi:hypothetical protein